VFKLGRDGKPHKADWFFIDNLHQGGRPWTYNAGGYKQGWTGQPNCTPKGKLIIDKSGVTRINPYPCRDESRYSNDNSKQSRGNTTVVNVQQGPAQPQMVPQPQILVQQAAPQQPQMMIQQQQPQMMVQQQQQPQMVIKLITNSSTSIKDYSSSEACL